MDVITFGEAMVLLVADTPGPLEEVSTFHKRTAGAETNVAIGLARLGLDVGWASSLGNDPSGRYLLEAIRREGVDCSHVSCVTGQRTGLMFKGKVLDGSDPAIEYHRQGSAASRYAPEDIDAAWLTSARHLHVTGIMPALSDSCLAATRRSIALMREAGRTISFDPNLRPRLWPSTAQMTETINEIAGLADWVLPGIEEGKLLSCESTPEGIAAFYLARGAKRVVVKLGPRGAYHAGMGASGHVAGFAVEKVVDTVGAGDGFAVGVISGLLEGRPIGEAVARGNWIGARAVQVAGDTEGLPSRAELHAFTAQGGFESR